MKEIDHEWTDYPVCPYCGYEHKDLHGRVETGKFTCSDCDKNFFCDPYYSVNYNTAQVPCYNGTPHEMKKGAGIPDHWESVPWNCIVCLDHTEWRKKEPE